MYSAQIKLNIEHTTKTKNWLPKTPMACGYIRATSLVQNKKLLFLYDVTQKQPLLKHVISWSVMLLCCSTDDCLGIILFKVSCVHPLEFLSGRWDTHCLDLQTSSRKHFQALPSSFTAKFCIYSNMYKLNISLPYINTGDINTELCFVISVCHLELSRLINMSCAGSTENMDSMWQQTNKHLSNILLLKRN